MIPFVDLKEQYSSLKSEIDAAISEVFKQSWFILGEQVSAFENEFAAYCGVEYGVGVGSGTEALHLALLAIGLKPGDEVITVANTAVPTIAAIDFAGGKPVFVDIDPDTYTIDSAKIERAITARTKVILPVHLYGCSADLGPIIALAKKYKLQVVEDCAQAHGAMYKGKKVGSFGAAGCFSFYPSKNLGTYGDGGMVVASDPGIAEKVRLLRNYGQTKRYVHKIRGFNSRLDELHAAILRVKLKRLDQWNRLRDRIAALYLSLLDPKKYSLPKIKNDLFHVFHLFVIRALKRDKLKSYLEEKGIKTEIHYPLPVHLQEAYLYLGVARGGLPVTEKYADEILSLPMYPELTEQNVRHVAEVMNAF